MIYLSLIFLHRFSLPSFWALWGADLQTEGYLGHLLTSRWSTWTVRQSRLWMLKEHRLYYNGSLLPLQLLVLWQQPVISRGVFFYLFYFVLHSVVNCFITKKTSKVKVCLYLTAETACNVCFLTVFQIVVTNWPNQSPSAVVIPQIVVPSDFTFSFIKFWWWNIFHTLTLSNKTKSVARLWKKTFWQVKPMEPNKPRPGQRTIHRVCVLRRSDWGGTPHAFFKPKFKMCWYNFIQNTVVCWH